MVESLFKKRRTDLDLHLKNLNVLITGGSRGIGRACAEILLVEGANVSICGRGAKDVAQTVSALSSGGGQIIGASCDVSDGTALSNWVAQSAKELGGIDIVIANASALVNGTEEADWSRAFETDLMQAIRLTNAATPFLEASDHAALTFISSVSAREVDGTSSAYGAMKLALQKYAKDLAVTVAPNGIRSNIVAPGTTYFEGGVWQQIETHMPVMFKEALAANPMGRMASAEEIARTVVFLSSPASSFTSGSVFTVDGALTKSVQI